MSTTHKILSVLLVLMLASSNMAFSGHVSSHAPTDSGLCSMCMHAGELDTTISPKSGAFFVILTKYTFSQEYTSTLFQPVISQDNQSRAPPLVA